MTEKEQNGTELDAVFDGNYMPNQLATATFKGEEVGAVERVDGKINQMGSLIQISVADMLIPNDFVIDAWQKLGVPACYSLNIPTVRQAFQNAVMRYEKEINKSREQTSVNMNNENYRCEWSIKHLSQTEYFVSRRIYIVSGNVEKRISTVDICRIEFDSETETVSFKQFDGSVDLCANVRDSITRLYSQTKTCVDSSRVRYMVRSFIYDNHGCQYGQGKSSNYFVPVKLNADGEDEVRLMLSKFRSFMIQANDKYGTLDNCFKSDIRCIPVIAMEQTRKDLANDIAMEVESRYMQLLDKVEKSLANKTFNGMEDDKIINEMGRHIEALGAIKKIKEQYEHMLNMEISIAKVDRGLPLMNIDGVKTPIDGRVRSMYGMLMEFAGGEAPPKPETKQAINTSGLENLFGEEISEETPSEVEERKVMVDEGLANEFDAPKRRRGRPKKAIDENADETEAVEEGMA